LGQNDYSIDLFLKTAFLKELQNNLYLKEENKLTEKDKIVIDFLVKRIKEIDERYKL
jgi:hypothetical protein